MKPITPNAATARETKRELRAINTQLKTLATTYRKTERTAKARAKKLFGTAIHAMAKLYLQQKRDQRALVRQAAKLQTRAAILQGRLQ